LKKELYSIMKDAAENKAEDNAEEKEKFKSVISNLSRQIDNSLTENEKSGNNKKNKGECL